MHFIRLFYATAFFFLKAVHCWFAFLYKCFMFDPYQIKRLNDIQYDSLKIIRLLNSWQENPKPLTDLSQGYPWYANEFGPRFLKSLWVQISSDWKTVLRFASMARLPQTRTWYLFAGWSEKKNDVTKNGTLTLKGTYVIFLVPYSKFIVSDLIVAWRARERGGLTHHLPRAAAV